MGWGRGDERAMTLQTEVFLAFMIFALLQGWWADRLEGRLRKLEDELADRKRGQELWRREQGL